MDDMNGRDRALVEVLRGLERRGHMLRADDVRTVLDGDEVALRRPPQTHEEALRATGEAMLEHMRKGGIVAARRGA